MRKQLDLQLKDLEEKRKKFEMEKQQFEKQAENKKGLERSDSSSKSLK
jgi:hypothetical protein